MPKIINVLMLVVGLCLGVGAASAEQSLYVLAEKTATAVKAAFKDRGLAVKVRTTVNEDAGSFYVGVDPVDKSGDDVYGGAHVQVRNRSPYSGDDMVKEVLERVHVDRVIRGQRCSIDGFNYRSKMTETEPALCRRLQDGPRKTPVVWSCGDVACPRLPGAR